MGKEASNGPNYPTAAKDGYLREGGAVRKWVRAIPLKRVTAKWSGTAAIARGLTEVAFRGGCHSADAWRNVDALGSSYILLLFHAQLC